MTFAETPIVRLGKQVTGGYDIAVKRDDLLPFSFGGNKVRIADAFIEDMRKSGSDALIFYGDRRSNLCRVLANRCFIERIPALMIATEEHAPEGGFEPYNSRLIRSFGVPVIDCAKTAIAEAVDEAFARLKAEGHRPYYIYGDRTGSGNEGTAASAYAKAYREIASYEERTGESFDLIAVPYGTGATLSGLICGALASREEASSETAGSKRPACRRIVGLSISSRTPQRAESLLKAGIRDWFEKEGRLLPEDWEDAVHLETAYNKGGYGLYDDEVRETIRLMLREEGIPLDPTYTGKAYAGLLRYLRDREDAGETFAGKKILFLHTGGLPLFFDYLTEGQ